MTPSLTIIIGGARSGKSSFAQSLAAKLGERVTFLATAEARDAEMRERIQLHRRERPTHWSTIEVPQRAAQAIREAKSSQVIVLDCLTLLVSNVLLGESCGAFAETRVEAEISDLLTAYHDGSAHLIVVTNEVGLGVVPAYELGRTYRDLLGRTNAMLVKAADKVYWMVAGLALEVKASRLGIPWEDINVSA